MSTDSAELLKRTVSATSELIKREKPDRVKEDEENESASVPTVRRK